MKTLRTFPTAEEAHVCATWLKNQGINAHVIDESGYGGNLMAAGSAKSIRIDVDESEFDLGMTLLNEEWKS